MTDLREAAQMALDALEEARDAISGWGSYASTYFQVKHNLEGDIDDCEAVIEALRAALAQPEQEPWGYISHKAWKMPVFVEAENLEVSGLPFNNPNYTPVYKAPQQREWQGLTDEEMFNLWVKCPAETEDRFAFARAIETKLKEKNT